MKRYKTPTIQVLDLISEPVLLNTSNIVVGGTTSKFEVAGQRYGDLWKNKGW